MDRSLLASALIEGVPHLVEGAASGRPAAYATPAASAFAERGTVTLTLPSPLTWLGAPERPLHTDIAS